MEQVLTLCNQRDLSLTTCLHILHLVMYQGDYEKHVVLNAFSAVIIMQSEKKNICF